VPIWRSDEEKDATFAAAASMVAELRTAGVRATADLREGLKPGAKYFEWEARGTPLRLEVGPRDIAAGTVMAARRTGGKESMPIGGLAERVKQELDAIQAGLLKAALERREANSLRGPSSKQEFIDFLENDGGLVYAGFCGAPVVEQEIKEATNATIRCIPNPELRSPTAPTTCIWTGRPATLEAIWARAY